MEVSVPVLRIVLAACRDLGLRTEQLVEAAALDPEVLEDASAFVPTASLDRLALAALELSGDEALGLRVGCALRPQHVVGDMVMASRTPREAFALFARFSGLVDSGQWSLIDEAELSTYRYAQATGDPRVQRFKAEAMIATLTRMGASILGPNKPPLEVRFRHEARSSAPYVELLRCPVRFSQPFDELVARGRVLDAPNVFRDEAARTASIERAERLLAQRDADGRLVERVSRLIRHALDADAVSTESVARALGLTASTLRRRLREHGQSLQHLVARARIEVATSALRDAALPIKAVAERVGFSEPSAFHRAFKRWVGVTPAQYREASEADARRIQQEALAALPDTDVDPH